MKSRNTAYLGHHLLPFAIGKARKDLEVVLVTLGPTRKRRDGFPHLGMAPNHESSFIVRGESEHF